MKNKSRYWAQIWTRDRPTRSRSATKPTEKFGFLFFCALLISFWYSKK